MRFCARRLKPTIQFPFKSSNRRVRLFIAALLHPVNCGAGLAESSLFHGIVILNALHDRGGTRVGCMESTRQLVFEAFFTWLESGDKPLLWLSGPAGYGKSAISQSIAEICASKGILAATYFFLRGAGARSDLRYLITTLAYQLTLFVPTTKPAIESALREDVKIESQLMEDQLEKLIIRPLTALVESGGAPFVIILDALDECDDGNAMHTFLGILIKACSSRKLPVRFLLTSRREDHIIRAFTGDVASAAGTPLKLEDFDAAEDIKAYLRSRFADIIKENPRLMQDVIPPWPSMEDLAALVKKSSGLFIFASTLAEFVGDGKGAPPNQKLKTVLSLHSGLDPLYTQVLTVPAIAEIACFPRVLTTLMLVSKQPSIRLLADLLRLSTQEVLHALMSIQSIIHIPSDNDSSIQLIHTSLRDFLTKEQRSKELFINPPTAHFVLAIECVKLLNTTLRLLPQDKFPADFALKYATYSWISHLNASSLSRNLFPEMTRALTELCSSKIFCAWVNMALMFILKNRSTGFSENLDHLTTKLQVCPAFHLF